MRCCHCGLERDRQTLDASCPHCADVRPGVEPAPEHAVRCDGCGHARDGAACETIVENGTTVGTYCWGCLDVLDEQGIAPGGHEQYTLL
jgi:hypothetical protein